MQWPSPFFQRDKSAPISATLEVNLAKAERASPNWVFMLLPLRVHLLQLPLRTELRLYDLGVLQPHVWLRHVVAHLFEVLLDLVEPIS